MIKKFIIAAALFVVSLCFADNLSAGNFGISGGASFHTSDFKGVGPQTLTQWNAGLVYKCDLPLGFQIHPALLYNVKTATSVSEQNSFSVGYLELMASAQWGVDLILFRPYLEVAPFVGYSLNGLGVNNPISDWKSPDRLEYGVGLGGGVQIWRFQIDARYNWTFADIKNVKDANFNGVSLSLTFFFGKQKER